jgi:hypothetical protein
VPQSGDNQVCSVTQGIGLVRVTAEYCSPNVHAPDGKDRAGHIWGELVPYGLYDLAYGSPSPSVTIEQADGTRTTYARVPSGP